MLEVIGFCGLAGLAGVFADEAEKSGKSAWCFGLCACGVACVVLALLAGLDFAVAVRG